MLKYVFPPTGPLTPPTPATAAIAGAVVGVVAVVVLRILLVVVIIVVLAVRHKKMENSKADPYDRYDRVLHHHEPVEDNDFHKYINSSLENTFEDIDDDSSITEDNRGPTFDDVENSTKESRPTFAIHPQEHVGTRTHTTTRPGGKTIGLGPLSAGYDDSYPDSQQYDAIVVHTTTKPGGKTTGVGPISAEYDVVDDKTHPQQYDVVLTHMITQPGKKTSGLMAISAGYEDLDSGCTNTTTTKTEQKTKASCIETIVYTLPDKSKKMKKGKKPAMKKKQ